MTWTEIDSAVTSPAESGITFTNLLAAVVLNCNNLPTQHPHYASIATYTNEAIDELQTLMMSASGRNLLDMAPRLKDWRWYDTTIDGQNYLPLPANMLSFESATYTKLTTAYAPSATTEYPMFEETDPVLFGLFAKATSGWPTRYRRAGARIEMWPTPDSSPVDYRTVIVIRGARKEDTPLSAAQTLKMDRKLHSFVIELATAISMEKMGWNEAPARRDSIEKRLAKYMNVNNLEHLRQTTTTSIKGTPR